MFRLRRRTGPPPKPERIRHVHLIDTSIASDNIGDEIIVEACRAILGPRFSQAYVSTSSGHDGLGPFGRVLAKDADLILLLGTNALAPGDQTKRRFVWHIAPEDVEVLAGKVVLFGVGANRAFEEVDRKQQALLRSVLSPHFRHSVRDGLALEILKVCGLEGINTSCPTLWRFADDPPEPPSEKADTVCFTLTKHKAASEDAAMIDILRELYEQVHFWPQQPRDLTYLKEITDPDGLEIVPPNLPAYDRFLSAGAVDVVGTRLHGSIRGLHHGRRALAIAIDNRAASIGQECGLPVLARAEVPDALRDRLTGPIRTELSIPADRIATFLSQF